MPPPALWFADGFGFPSSCENLAVARNASSGGNKLLDAGLEETAPHSYRATSNRTMLPSFYYCILEKYLNPQQLFTLQMLAQVVTISKQLRIERLAATLPLTILQNSRRRHIQRFLSIKSRAHTCDLVPDY